MIKVGQVRLTESMSRDHPTHTEHSGATACGWTPRWCHAPQPPQHWRVRPYKPELFDTYGAV